MLGKHTTHNNKNVLVYVGMELYHQLKNVMIRTKLIMMVVMMNVI